jgi:hypothetical protein
MCTSACYQQNVAHSILLCLSLTSIPYLPPGLDRSTQENSLEKDEDQDLQDDLAVFQKTPRLFEEATQGAVLNFVSWIWGAGGVSNGKIERETIGNTSMPCAGDAPCDPRLSERSKVTLPDDEMAHDGVEDSGDLKSWTLLECKEMLEKAIAGIHSKSIVSTAHGYPPSTTFDFTC